MAEIALSYSAANMLQSRRCDAAPRRCPAPSLRPGTRRLSSHQKRRSPWPLWR